MVSAGSRAVIKRAVALGAGGFIALMLLMHPGAVWAESADPAAAVAGCLAKWEKTPERCIGIVGDACVETANSTADMVECYDREQAVWDKMLNRFYQQLLKAMTPAQTTHLRAMQRSWIETRDLTCGFYDTFYQGTMAQPMIAACANRETARRALLLQGFADPQAPGGPAGP